MLPENDLQPSTLARCQSYFFAGIDDLPSPNLVFYKDQIDANTRQAIDMAGSADRLWPHIKTHKTAELVALQIEMGITHFKCATIAEAELAASCKAAAVLLAYPLVGPAILRFIHLQTAYPAVRFGVIGDDLSQLSLLGQASVRSGITTHVLMDLNPGMNRTGVPEQDALAFYRQAAQIQGIAMNGIHCFDGNRHEAQEEARCLKCQETAQSVLQIRQALENQGINCGTVIMGGSPSFPCYAAYREFDLSPGTLFLHDFGYATHFPDLPFLPAAAVLTRVISRPGPGQFTLDLGCKGIASDPPDLRGQLIGLEHAEPLFQSEEHWAWHMKDGHEKDCPAIGTAFFVIPTHICPTVALYAEATVIEQGSITGQWQIAARNRHLTF